MPKHLADTITLTALAHEFAAQIEAGWPVARRARSAACASYPHLGARHADQLVSWDTRSKNVAGFEDLQWQLRQGKRRKVM